MTKFFSQHEFASPDTGETWIDNGLVKMLDKARTLANGPFIITSGCRTPEYNLAIGGTFNSAHLRGLAADIAVRNSEWRIIMVNQLLGVGFQRIGIGPNFIHVDVDTSLPRPRMWTY